MIKATIERFKNLNPKDKKHLTIFTIIYSIMIPIFIFLNIGMGFNNSYILITNAVMFIFFTTTYITVFFGELGKKLSETKNFTKHFNKNITDLYLITNYFYLGCVISFLQIILIIVFSGFNLNINIIILYLFGISLFFLYWIFNITFNIISNPKRI